VRVVRAPRGREQVFDHGRELLAREARDPSTVGLTLALGCDEASVRPDEVLAAIFGGGRTRPRLVREELLVDAGGRLAAPLG
jgi:hypothetical protein